MERLRKLVSFAIALATLSGCAHTWQTATLGAANGAVTGFGMGGLITGTRSGSALGAGLGVATGALSGYLISEVFLAKRDKLAKQNALGHFQQRCEESQAARPPQGLFPAPPIQVIRRGGAVQWGTYYGPHEEASMNDGSESPFTEREPSP